MQLNSTGPAPVRDAVDDSQSSKPQMWWQRCCHAAALPCAQWHKAAVAVASLEGWQLPVKGADRYYHCCLPPHFLVALGSKSVLLHLYWYCRSNQALASSYLLAPRPQNLILLPRSALGCGCAFFPVAALSEPPGMFWNKPQNFSSKLSVFSRSCCDSASSVFRKAPRSGRAVNSSSDFWGTWELMRSCWSCCRSLMKRFGFCTALALLHVVLAVF